MTDSQITYSKCVSRTWRWQSKQGCWTKGKCRQYKLNSDTFSALYLLPMCVNLFYACLDNCSYLICSQSWNWWLPGQTNYCTLSHSGYTLWTVMFSPLLSPKWQSFRLFWEQFFQTLRWQFFQLYHLQFLCQRTPIKKEEKLFYTQISSMTSQNLYIYWYLK